MNFNEFINQYRIEYAKNLLNAETKKTILDVAYESGYNSKSAFYKHFTSVTSMTPAQYRKSRNAQPESVSAWHSSILADIQRTCLYFQAVTTK